MNTGATRGAFVHIWVWFWMDTWTAWGAFGGIWIWLWMNTRATGGAFDNRGGYNRDVCVREIYGRWIILGDGFSF